MKLTDTKADTLSNTAPTASQASPSKNRGAKLGEIVGKSDLPEFIKAEELQSIFPFTIFGAHRNKGRFGDRFKFDVAFKRDGVNVEKKVLTLSANEEREQLAFSVKKFQYITDCRLIQINLGGGQTYWKIVDANAPIAEEISVQQATVTDDDIPF